MAFESCIILAEEKRVSIKTKHGELTLEQLAEVQPGMARLMKEIGERYHILYYAAKGGNWLLAQHELNQVIALLRAGSMLRPKYAKDITDFTREYFQPVTEAITSREWKKFEDTYNKGIDGSNVYHDKYGYGYIRYVLPRSPPEFYDLRPHEKKKS